MTTKPFGTTSGAIANIFGPFADMLPTRTHRHLPYNGVYTASDPAP